MKYFERLMVGNLTLPETKEYSSITDASGFFPLHLLGTTLCTSLSLVRFSVAIIVCSSYCGGSSSTSSYLGGRSLRGDRVVGGLRYSLTTASTSMTTFCGLGRDIRMNCFCMCLQHENTAILAKNRNTCFHWARWK